MQLMERMNTNHRPSLVDVRDLQSFQAGHLPGAVNIPENSWDAPAGLSRSAVNILYCHGAVCHLAAHAAERFAALGYQVAILEGGYSTWAEVGLPIEKAS